MKNQKTIEEILLENERVEKALEKLSGDMIKKIRNANRCLYPLDWNKVKLNWKYGELPFGTADEFEICLKEVCDSLYNWGLYEACPQCKKGIKIPVWGFRGYTAFCGCSEYPKCNYTADREGKPIR